MTKRARKKYNRRQSKAIADYIYNEANGDYPILIFNDKAYILRTCSITRAVPDIGGLYSECIGPEYDIHAVLHSQIYINGVNRKKPIRRQH